MTRPALTFVSAIALLWAGCASGNNDAVATNENGDIDASASDGAAHDGSKSEASAGDAGGDSPLKDDAGCGPWTCTGCCAPSGDCLSGISDTACGTGGPKCVDCATQGSICPGGTCLNCSPDCSGKPCDDGDGCGGMCGPGSGCCTPSCAGKLCGQPDGCGGSCAAGSGCCTPSCSGKNCGASDGCGSTCSPGSGCCTPSCSGKNCGASDGCGGTCSPGSGCCSPSCAGATCGGSDGCGGTCDGTCPGWEHCSNKQCECSPSPSFEVVGGVCLPSCGRLLSTLSMPNTGGGCCPGGCQPGTFGGGPGATHDCNYCCSSSQPGVATCN